MTNKYQYLSKEDICAIIITYNAENLIETTIEHVHRNVGSIIVVDNNSFDTTLIVLKRYISSNFAVVQNKKNYGIAKALNQGVKLAIEMGYKWVLTLDQDSLISDKMITEMIDVYSSLTDIYKEQVACLAPFVVYSNQYSNRSNKEYFEKDVVITSGNLVKIDIIKEIGGYEEKLFIDSVDFDFCLKLKINKKKILICNNAKMRHSLGESVIKRILGLNFSIHIHNQIRKYYMSRNHIYIIKRYFLNNTKFCLKKNVFYILFILQNIILEDNKFTNIKSISKGVFDGLRDKYDGN